MLSSEEAMRPRWGDRVGWHEIYGLKVCDPRQGVALWLRYVLVSPVEGEPFAELWGVAFDQHARVTRTVLRDVLPFGEEIRLESQPFAFQIGRSVLTDHGARGRLDGHDERLGWVMQWEPAAEAFSPFPRAIEDRSWITTKHLIPQPRMEVAGEILINRRRVSLVAAPGLLVHQWGTKYPIGGVWAHCAAFEDAPEAVFEGLVTAIAPIGPFEPKLSMFRMHLDGEDYVSNGTLKVLTTKSSYGLSGWSFAWEAGNRKFVGELDVPVGAMFGVVDQDPDGEPYYVHHTQSATLNVQVFAKERGRWELERELVATQAVTMELASRAADPETPFLIEASPGFGG